MPHDLFDPRNPIDWVALAFLVALMVLAVIVMAKALV